VFLSYSPSDRARAQRIIGGLREGIDVWTDANMKVGNSIVGEITKAIQDADFVVSLVSPASRKSNIFAAETAMAVARRARELAGRRSKIAVGAD
jgi:predicted nucleotide-binding protein